MAAVGFVTVSDLRSIGGRFISGSFGIRPSWLAQVRGDWERFADSIVNRPSMANHKRRGDKTPLATEWMVRAPGFRVMSGPMVDGPSPLLTPLPFACREMATASTLPVSDKRAERFEYAFNLMIQ
jgi:hypothetical protein